MEEGIGVAEQARDETLIILLSEHQKLRDACERVYLEELNHRWDATPDSLRRAIRDMMGIVEASIAPGRLKVHRMVGMN